MMTNQKRADVAYLDDMLLEPSCRPGYPRRLPRSVPAIALKDVPTLHLTQWCVEHGVYQVVTDELLNWLAEKIQGKKAIEICAGHGTIGRALGIPMTDSYMQTTPEMRAYYEYLGQAIIEPPPDVVKMDANEAVSSAGAEIVIGSWVSQKWIPGDIEGSDYGVDEVEILACGVRYIHIGNCGTHAYKRLMKMPHHHLHAPWLFSRASRGQSDNHICTWSQLLLEGLEAE